MSFALNGKTELEGAKHLFIFYYIFMKEFNHEIEKFSTKIEETTKIFERKRICTEILGIESLTAKEKEQIIKICFPNNMK